MIDAASIAFIAVTFAASKVAHKVADDTVEALWARIKKRLSEYLRGEPTAAALTPQVVSAARANDPAAFAGLEAFYSGSAALRRAAQQENLLKDARVLWVDDHPVNNSWERRSLEVLGVRFVTAETTESGVALARNEPFHAIVSDIGRDKGPSGLEGLPKIRAVAPQVPVIFYVGNMTPGAPAGSIGITNDPEELVHLLLDALGRTRS